MSNDKVRQVIEKAGFKVTSNMGYEDGEQVIISYSARKGRITWSEPSLYGLMESLGLKISQ